MEVVFSFYSCFIPFDVGYNRVDFGAEPINVGDGGFEFGIELGDVDDFAVVFGFDALRMGSGLVFICGLLRIATLLTLIR